MAEYLDIPRHDGVIVQCFQKESCLRFSEITTEIKMTGLNIVTFAALHKSTFGLDLLTTVKNTKFVLIFCCCHIHSTLEREMKQHLIPYQRKVILISESNMPVHNMKEFKHFTVNETTWIIQHIQNEIMAYSPEPERYRSLAVVERHPPKSFPRKPNLIKGETIPKYLEDFNSHSPTGFIHAETFDDNDAGNRGIYILKTTCLPKDPLCLPVNDIKRRFNAANQENREDLSKQILVITLKNVSKNCDFLGMLNLLDIDDLKIQSSVFSAIDEFQLETNLYSRCLRGTDVLRAVKYLLELCRKWSANQYVIVQLLPVTLDTVANLYLASCISGTYQSNLVPEILIFCESSIPIVDKMISDSSLSAECSDFLYSLKKLFKYLKAVGINPSPLQLGNFRDTLMSENNRVLLKKKFTKKMNYLEQYALVLITINQIVMKSDLQIVDFLKELAEILTEIATKKTKYMQITFAVFKLITKGIVHRLCKGLSLPRMTAEYQMKLCKVLNIFLATPKVTQIARLHLLEMIEPLLFRETKDLITNVVCLFQTNNQQSKDIREKVSKYIVQQLSAVNFKLDGILHQSTKVGLEPSWITFAGTVSDDKHVVMYALIPTLHCIVEGSMTDYKLKANQSETRKHLNTLDILKHLQDEKLHHNLIQLIAFQCRPLPIFYITDAAVDHDLNSHLLDARKTFRWISYRELITMAADAVDAMSYLHSRSVIHRNLTTFAFSLRHKNIVLHDFSVSKIIDKDTGFISDVDNIEIPVLWSAPESILEDRYDTKTDIWMLGQFMYEVFTHGCHPYTEVYGTATEELLEFIVFQDLKPHKWMCIPKDVHDIITACVATKPEDRIDILRVRKLLSNVLITFQGRNTRVTQIFEEDKKYPEMDTRQGSPERGLPQLFQQLKTNNTQDTSIIRKSYFNLRRSQRRPLNDLYITPSDIKSPDQPIFQSKFRYITVFEPVSVDFIRLLPHLDNKTCTEVLHFVDTPSREERRNIPGNCSYLLKYKMKKSTKLFELAFKKFCGDPEENSAEYLQIVLNLLNLVREMHDRNWIIRDLCADNIFVTNDEREVTIPRLGQMLRFENNNVLDDCIIDEVRKERRRWLPIEILQNGQYSKEGDIYMIAMVIYEFYMALDIHEGDPMAGQLECAPFAKVPKELLLKHLYSGEVPLQPDYCPSWLYDILKQCWNRDRTRRPTISFIISEITKMMNTNNEPGDFEVDSNDDDYDRVNEENYKSLEERDKKIKVYDALNKSGKSDLQTTDTDEFTSVRTFNCVNSDTGSTVSINSLETQPSMESTSSSAYASFQCINSLTSESDNEYMNITYYTDAKSSEISIDRKKNGSTSQISHKVFESSDLVGTTDDNKCSLETPDLARTTDENKCISDMSRASSSYFSVKNIHRSHDCSGSTIERSSSVESNSTTHVYSTVIIKNESTEILPVINRCFNTVHNTVDLESAVYEDFDADYLTPVYHV